MKLDVAQIATATASLFAGLSDQAERFDEFLSSNVTFVPPTVVYLALFIIAVLVIVQAAKVAFRLAVYIVLPTIGSALLVTFAFPSIDAINVLPAAAAVFTGIFVFKK